MPPTFNIFFRILISTANAPRGVLRPKVPTVHPPPEGSMF
jgi:hypothetical protein